MAFLDHTLGIMTHPDSEWLRIRRDKHDAHRVYFSHVPFLALIPVASAFIGMTQVGWSVAGSEPVYLTLASALALSIATYIGMLVGVCLLGEFITWMAKTYGVTGADKSRHYEGFALAVYVTTPLFLAGVSHLYPMLWLNVAVFMAAGCYAVYLLYQGIPILMDIPKERGFLYASAVVMVGLVLIVATAAASVIVWSSALGPVFSGG